MNPQTLEPVHTRPEQPLAANPATISKESNAPAQQPNLTISSNPQTITQKPPTKSQTKLPPKPKADNGVTIAIISTVIIVIVLAALAVFAYLKTQK